MIMVTNYFEPVPAGSLILPQGRNGSKAFVETVAPQLFIDVSLCQTLHTLILFIISTHVRAEGTKYKGSVTLIIIPCIITSHISDSRDALVNKRRRRTLGKTWNQGGFYY